MKKNNVLIYTLDEFKALCDKVFGETAWIENECGQWFWVMSEEIDENTIMDKLKAELAKEIDGLLDQIYVDITKGVVIISSNNV